MKYAVLLLIISLLMSCPTSELLETDNETNSGFSIKFDSLDVNYRERVTSVTLTVSSTSGERIIDNKTYTSTSEYIDLPNGDYYLIDLTLLDSSNNPLFTLDENNRPFPFSVNNQVTIEPPLRNLYFDTPGIIIHLDNILDYTAVDPFIQSFFDRVDKVRITLKKIGDNFIYSSEDFDVTCINGTFQSWKINLDSGSYQLTELYLIDENSNRLFLAPENEDYNPALDSLPLLSEFDISSSGTVYISPEIKCLFSEVTYTSNDSGFNLLIKNYDGFTSANITLRNNFSVLKEYYSDTGNIFIEMPTEIYDYYQIDIIKSGYLTRTITFSYNEFEELLNSTYLTVLLRSSEELVFAHNEWGFNAVVDMGASIYSYISSETRELYSPTDINWEIVTLEGSELSVDEEGVVDFITNSSGKYIISANNISDFYLEVVPLEHNSFFNTFIESFISESETYGWSIDQSIIGSSLIVNFAVDDLISAYGVTLTPDGNSDYRVILIHERYWNLFTETKKEMLMYHELAHALLSRDEHVNEFVNHKAISLLNENVPSQGIYQDLRDSYMNELFTNDTTVIRSALENYSTENVDLIVSGVSRTNIGTLYIYVENIYQTEVNDFVVSLDINNEIYYTPHNNTSYSYSDNAFGMGFHAHDIPELAPGQVFIVTVTVDPDDRVTELDEQNNSQTLSIVW